METMPWKAGRVVVLGAGLVFSSPAARGAEITAFVDVAVVRVDGPPRVEPHSTVIVVRDRITAVGPTGKVKVPSSAALVQGSGKFLMAGIAEMHGHLPGEGTPAAIGELWLKLFVANGVTTVRGVLGAPGQLALRERIRRGEVLGPRLFVYGPAMTGEEVKTPGEGRAAVRQQKAAGYDGIKIHEGLSLATYQAIVRAAKQARLPFGGHVPNEVGLERALAAGQRSIDHLDGYLEAMAPHGVDHSKTPGPPFLSARSPELDQLDAGRIPSLVAATRKARARVVPTMALWRILFDGVRLSELQQLPELKYFPPQGVEGWTKQQAAAEKDPPPPERVHKMMDLRDRVLAALAAHPGLVMLGSDAPQRFSVPGFSLRHEVAAMVRAGMTAEQVVYAATVAPARFLGRERDLGTVSKGKRADLILTEANPLDDAGNIFRSAGVMVAGRWLPRAELDRLLAEIEQVLVYPSPAEIKDLDIPASESQPLLGKYAFENRTMTVAIEDGRLVLTAHHPQQGDRTLRLRSQGGGVYLMPEVKSKVTFEMKNGRATALIGSQSGAQMRAVRVEP